MPHEMIARARSRSPSAVDLRRGLASASARLAGRPGSSGEQDLISSVRTRVFAGDRSPRASEDGRIDRRRPPTRRAAGAARPTRRSTDSRGGNSRATFQFPDLSSPVPPGTDLHADADLESTRSCWLTRFIRHPSPSTKPFSAPGSSCQRTYDPHECRSTPPWLRAAGIHTALPGPSAVRRPGGSPTAPRSSCRHATIEADRSPPHPSTGGTATELHGDEAETANRLLHRRYGWQ